LSTYSLIALDIDGTMIGQDRTVSDDLRDAIARVRDTGAVVSVATGRTLPPAARVARQSGATGPVICFQGAMTFDQSLGKPLRHVTLSPSIARSALESLTGVAELMMFIDNDVWVETESEWTNGYSQRMEVNVLQCDSFNDVIHKRPTAIVGIDDEQKIIPMVQSVRDAIGDRAIVTHSLPMFCEIEAAGAGKDHAVSELATSLGIDRSAVVAVGDGKGDQTMIEWAGLGVAVKGGHPEVEAIADRIIGTPENGGLISLLHELCDNRLLVSPSMKSSK